MNNPHLTLISKVEHMVGRKLSSQRDFVWMSELILSRTKESVSPTTLRRLWGYSHEGVQPRRFTLDVLSRFLLFSDFDDFCGSAHNEEVQSDLSFGNAVQASDLEEGELLRLTWQPDRVCVVRHLGNGQFEIAEARNTKLSVGDTFTCQLFINHEPVYLNNLIHNGEGPYRYVAGKQTGIVVEKAAHCEMA